MRIERIVEITVGLLGGVGRTYSDVYSTFDVEIDKGSRPNKATVELYGLAESSIAWIEEAAAQRGVLIISAGERFPSVLYQGRIDRRGVSTRLSAPETITTIKAGDGRIAYREATYKASYPPGISTAQILPEILAQFSGSGVAVGYVDPSLVPVTYPSGWAFSGKARDALDEITSDLGGEWTIERGVLEIVREGAAAPGDAVVVSPATGLRGSVETTDKGIRGEITLTPSLRRGRPISVASKRATGFYRPTKVRHRGDQRGSTWVTEFEAVPLT